MRQLVHLICTAFLCLLTLPLWAQEYHVQHYNAASGLSDDHVTDVHKDAFGYLWVATAHGLNQYNGHDFRIFRYDPEDAYSIRANSLKNLYEDHESNIWITLSVGGVSKYDRYKDQFYYYTSNPNRGQDPNNFIQMLLPDQKGRTWVGTSTHINLLDTLTELYNPIEVVGHVNVHVFGLYEDNSNQVWVGTGEGLFRYNEQQKRFEPFLNQAGKPIPEVVKFAQDKEGRLWAATYHDIYLLETGFARQIPTPSKRLITNLFLASDGEVFITQYEDQLYYWREDGWKVPPGLKEMPDGLRYAHAFKGSNEVFIADNARGYYLYHMLEGTTRKLAMIDDRVRSFWFGTEGRELWLGAPENGMYRVDLLPKTAQHVMLSKKQAEERPFANWVSQVVVLDNEEALAVIGDQLYQMNIQSRNLTAYESAGLKGLSVRTMRKMEDNQFLLLTNQGFVQFNTDRERVQKLTLQVPEANMDFMVAGDSLWTVGEYGLALTRLQTGETLFFRDLEYLPEVFRSGDIRRVMQDSHGDIWLGAVREGLIKLRFDRAVGRFVSKSFGYAGARTGPFKTHTVNTVLEDSQGRMWVGGFSSGLLEFDREQELFVNRNPAGETPIPHINTMIEAADGAIWLSAKDGVYRYEPEDEAFHRFSRQDGLSDAAFVLGSGTRLNANLMAFGTQAGLTLFETDRFVAASENPKVLLEQFAVQNSGLTLRHPVSDKAFRLKYNQNFISFDFLAFDYQAPEHVSYQYRLKGLEENWNTTRQRHVQYANLGPGRYTFEVRAGLETGHWSEELTRFEFDIHQPFWWQPWFLVLMSILLMSIVLIVNKVRMNMKLSRIKALETVRQNAAADFHDEMGNKLTRISLFTEVLEKKLNGTSPEISAYVKKIKDNSHVLNNSMRDFLWALDPEKDTAFDLIVMLKDFGDELFDNSGIEFHVASIKEVFRHYPLDMDWKRHLVMIFKEAMHNVLKHSNARTVTLKASLSKDVLNLSLADDGEGFRISRKNGGYGHANMRKRAEALGASISIESEEGEGTVVTFIGALDKKYETYD